MSDPPMPTHHGVEAPVEDPFQNEIIQLLHQRGIYRHFKDKIIPKKIIEQILGAAIHAPSGGNLQDFSIVKIENPDRNN